MGSRRCLFSPVLPLGSLRRRLAAPVQCHRLPVHSASITTKNSTRQLTCSTNPGREDPGWALTGDMTAAWLLDRRRALEATAPMVRPALRAWWIHPLSALINSLPRDCFAARYGHFLQARQIQSEFQSAPASERTC